MKIWYFSVYPGTNWITAGYTVNGKRYASIVWNQAGRLYVRTGAEITNDLVFHWFSEEQTAAFNEYCNSSSWSIEYKEGIA